MTTDKLVQYEEAVTDKFSKLEVTQLVTGFQFVEGPVWHPEQNLLFSDIPANKIWQLSPQQETIVYVDKSGCTHDNTGDLHEQIGSNGLAFDTEGALLICQHGNHAVARLDKKGELTPLITEYNGFPLNSPNDLVVHSNGSIYFTDPPYGLKDQVLNPAVYQPVAGLYRFMDGELLLLRDHLNYPNGVAFSPQQEYLYLTTNHPDEAGVWRYRLSSSGTILKESLLLEQNADGLTTDSQGDLWLCTDDGILIVSSEGKRLGLIPLPESPANITWAGNDRDAVLITARSSLKAVP
ncbi:MAG: SMP-30/gluconolactonase/LRE family protein, partial [Chitinophagaceae bacterium]